MNKIVNKVSLLFSSLLLINSVNAQNPAVNGGAVNPSPITEPTGISVSFQVVNFSDVPANPHPGSQITVTLSLLDVADDFNFSTDITGTASEFYTWEYDAAARAFTGTLANTLPARGGGSIVFSNLISVGKSNPGEELNGLIVNVNAPSAINSSTDDDYTDAFTSSTVILPLDLLSFTAQNNGCNANLEWVTVNEENTSHFSVEASNDGRSFKEVGRVKAAFNSSLKQTYHFNYEMKANSNYLFRLKMVDVDGQFTYSQIQRLSCGANHAAEIIASPNPTASEVKISGLTNGSYTVQITDLSGRQLFMTQVVDVNTTLLDLRKYPAGMYNVSVTDESGFTKNLKVAKQ